MNRGRGWGCAQRVGHLEWSITRTNFNHIKPRNTHWQIYRPITLLNTQSSSILSLSYNSFILLTASITRYFNWTILTIKTTRCQPGLMLSEDGKNCTDANECLNSPCLNGGTCKNLDRGEGFYCMCPDGFSGDICNALKQEKVMRLSTAALAAILICLINILSK